MQDQGYFSLSTSYVSLHPPLRKLNRDKFANIHAQQEKYRSKFVLIQQAF